jgi:hypothetical protein
MVLLMTFKITSLRYWPDVVKPLVRAWVEADRKENRPIPQHIIDGYKKAFGKRKRKKGEPR